MNFVSKKSIYLLALLVICLLLTVFVPTYAKFASGYESDTDVVGVTLSFDLSISGIEEYEEVVVPAGESEKFNVEITNQTGDVVHYGIWYMMVSPNQLANDMSIGRLKGTVATTSGSIENEGVAVVTLAIVNNSTSEMKFNLGVGSSSVGLGDIEYLGGKYLVTGDVEISKANVPKLDDGLIPVYYDEKNSVWKKADSSNKDNKWYDYYEKKWANAVMISDPKKRESYQKADVDTEIIEKDVVAFYVWIPRFKYRLWNVNRQTSDEDSYGYLAYTSGIDIEFEENNDSTGEVDCVYNNAAVSLDGDLSDVCFYRELESITAISSNKDYASVWYTHPAFSFNNEELTGFWIGKFETGGTKEEPVVLPNMVSLREQAVSEQFTTSKLFQSYGLSNEVNAHMLTNLEWGAVAYLTHSIYGLCDGISCRDVYINNSSHYYTGRSGGAISGSEDLSLSSVYVKEIDNLTVKYYPNGYYDYRGYFIDYRGELTNEKDITKVASTTGNITGVYDMSGGASEYVMANMVNEKNAFNPSLAGNAWNGKNDLDNFYYQSYSYSIYDDTQDSFNRARLGDATAEVVGMGEDSNLAWKSGEVNIGALSIMTNSELSWMLRGSDYLSSNAGIFSFSADKGQSSNNITFRSSLS